MNKKLLVGLLTVAFALAFASTAGATNVTFHFAWDINYDAPNFGANGDYLTDNSVDVVAKGVYFTVQKKITLLNWQTVFAGNADSSGSKTLNLTYGQTYRVMVVADALVNGNNQFRTFNHDPDPGQEEVKGDLYAQMVTSVLGFVLTSPTTDLYYTYAYIEDFKTSNIMAAATFAFNSNSVGIENDHLDFLTENISGGGGGYTDSDTEVPPLIGLHLDAPDRKFTIVHEMGHYVHYVTNEHDDFETGCPTYSDPDCDADNHAYGSLENQGCAAKEGFANFYAAAVFNNRYQTDCRYRGEDCAVFNHQMLDCKPLWPATYFESLGVEGDWTEFYWKLHSGSQTWELQEITDLFLAVDTTDWNGGDHANVIESLSEAAHDLYGSTMGNYFDDVSDLDEGRSCDEACIGF